MLCQAPTEYRMLAKRAELRPDRRAAPAGLGRRAAQPRGDPALPRARRAGDPRRLRPDRDGAGDRHAPRRGRSGQGRLDGPPAAGHRGAGARRRAAGPARDRARPSSATTSASQPFEGEWWPTGDQVREDEDGYLWFEGRDDDIIVTAGYRVGPFEVESALVSHPAVAEAAAVAAPDEERGSVVRAIVVLREGEPSEGLAAELQEHVKSVTAPYKYPRIVEFAEELPKTSSGKIRRGELRAAEGGRLTVVRAVPTRRAPAGGLLRAQLGLVRGDLHRHQPGPAAVGATLPVLPRFVTEELNGSDLEVGIVTGAFAFTGFFCRPIAGNAADRVGRRKTGDRRRLAGGDRRRPALPPRRHSRADRLAPLPRRRRGDGVHGGLRLERGHGARGAPRPDDRALRAGDLDRPHARPPGRRAAAAAGGYDLVWAFADGGAACWRR